MKVKALFLTAFAALSISQASAEVEILYHMQEGNYVTFTVIERSKKLFILDDDDNTQFEIKNYKKSGNVETFTIECSDNSLNRKSSANITITLDANGHTSKIQYKKSNFFSNGTYDVYTVDTDNPREHNRRIRYFNGLTGNPTEQGVVAEKGVPSVGQSGDSKNPADKVKGAAKDATKKLKGLFNKKK